MSKRASTILELLPPELFYKVSIRLTCYDVVALLKAFPGLQYHFVLITDHKRTPYAFDFPGIQRHILTYSEFVSKGLPKGNRRTMMRLFEFADHVDQMIKVTRRISYNSPCQPFKWMKPGNLVYVRMSGTERALVDASLNNQRLLLFLSATEAEYLVDNNPLGNVRTWPFALPTVFEHNLKHLHLENVKVLKDVVLANVKTMMLTFVKKEGHSKVISLSAPKLEKLAIVFESKFPVLSDNQFPKLNSLEVQDRRWLQEGFCNEPIKCDALTRDMILKKQIDLRFTSSCLHIEITGLPIEVMSLLRLDNVRALVWGNCIRPHERIDGSLPLEIRVGDKVQSLEIMNTVPDAKFTLARDHNPGIKNFTFITWAPGSDINGIMRKTNLEQASLQADIDPVQYPERYLDVPEVPSSDSMKSLKHLYVWGFKVGPRFLLGEVLESKLTKLETLEIEFQSTPDDSKNQTIRINGIPLSLRYLSLSQRSHIQRNTLVYATGTFEIRGVKIVRRASTTYAPNAPIQEDTDTSDDETTSTSGPPPCIVDSSGLSTMKTIFYRNRVLPPQPDARLLPPPALEFDEAHDADGDDILD